MKISGIYKIINKINKKYYVGSSKNIVDDRWQQHKANLRNNNHPNLHLQNAWNKYGEHNFKIVIVEKTNQLIQREQHYLDKAKQKKRKSYNLSFIADRPEMTNITRKKISKSTKKRLANKINHPFYGKKHTNKTKELIKQNSPRYGKLNGMFGVRCNGRLNPNFNNHKLKGENNPSFDDNKYQFINARLKITFTGTAWAFYTKYNLSQGNVSQMIHKNQNRSVKGWKFISKA